MITNQFGEQYLYAVNRGMFEQESAQERIEREFGKLLAREDSLIIFIGSDSGNIIRYVLDRDLPAGTRYIFVEPEEVLNQVAAVVDLGSLEDRVWLVTPEKLKETAQEASITNYMYVDGVFLKRCLSAEYGFFAQYRSEYWDADSYITDLRWNTLVSLGRDGFIQCQLWNCADNQHPISEIKGCLEGKTAIVLGGGPSLDEHLDWIQEHRKQLVVFSVSRISARLQQVGLEPDFVFSVDPQDISYQVSKEMLNFGPDVVFINQYHVAPRLLSQWRHRKFFMGKVLPWESELNPKEAFDGAGPTVTNSAIAAAAWLGSKKILLAGVDLCFTPEGFTHAQGSRERAAGPKTDLSSLVLETNSGEVANTTPDYAAAAANISLQASILQRKAVTLVNLSARAACMEHVLYRSPEDIQPELLPVELKLPHDLGACGQEKLCTLKQELSDKIDQVNDMLPLLGQAVELHDSMYEEEQVNPDLKQQLEQLDEQLADEYAEVLMLAKTLSARALLRMSQVFESVEELELEQIRNKLEIYYDALKAGAERFHQHLVAGLEIVNLRLQEQSLGTLTAQDADSLVVSWIKRGQPGRVFCLDSTSIKMGDRFAIAKKIYSEEMQRDQLAELTRQSKFRNLHALPMRIQLLKDKKDLNALETLCASLSEDVDTKPYLPLLNATICEMKQQPEAALAELLPVMEQAGSPILEQTLAMMVGLCTELGYHQAVMDAMAGLASLNAFYFNLYSDALMANGQAGDAIEHLTEYLHYFPGDKQALMKLKRWYSEHGSEEGVMLVQSLLQAKMSEE
jgi:hypothetical protein